MGLIVFLGNFAFPNKLSQDGSGAHAFIARLLSGREETKPQ
jgi:hypothetical protein